MATGRSADNRSPIDIIIPTYDNPQQLFSCVQSMLAYAFEYPLRIIVVNNGNKPCGLTEGSGITIINPGKNLGWEGGLVEGLKHSASKYVMFANDDVYIPRASSLWMSKMVKMLDAYSFIGAVGPSSNVVMGAQNIFHHHMFTTGFSSYLIGFCILLRREALDKAGGVHIMEHGGDDLDLSIRIRKSGYALVIARDVFVYHHGFQTGQRLYGGPEKPGGWNSREKIDETNMELIRKHGFMEFHNTVLNRDNSEMMDKAVKDKLYETDTEGRMIAEAVVGENVLELGCGARKTVPHAIGVDYTPKDELCPYSTHKSVADIVADVEELIPVEKASFDTVIARHILEHCLDALKTIKQWGDLVKPGGRLIVACPNEKITEGIPLNAQHKHAFTADTIKTMADFIGFREIGRNEDLNGVSFISILEKESV